MSRAHFILWSARMADTFRDLPMPARARGIGFELIKPRIFIPIRRRDFNRMARTAPALYSTSGTAFNWSDADCGARREIEGPDHLRNARRHVHAGRNLAGGGGTNCPSSRASASP